MKDALIISLLSVIPRKSVSRWMGAGTRTRLSKAFLRWYVKKYGVNMDEFVGELSDYDSLAKFFTRPLLPATRPVDAAPDALVSPVDALAYAVGTCVDGRLPQAGELDIVVQDLLGGDERYRECEFAVLYLSPKDYHRVHCPREGTIDGYRYRPGHLWPVFPLATRRVTELFAANERLVIRVGTDLGEIAVVMVGAFGVGRMTASFSPLVSNSGSPKKDENFRPGEPVERAAQLGCFELGSTVILLLPKGSVRWTISAGQPVRMGQRIAER